MAETTALLPRTEVNAIAFDPSGIIAVQTLLDSAASMLRNNDDHWQNSEMVSELLTEVENAVVILRRRCDHLCERDFAY
jgi:hypothetical protein